MTIGTFDYSNLEDHYGTIAAKLLRSRGFIARKYKGEVKVKVPKGIGNIKIQKADTLLSLVKRVESMFQPKEKLYEEPPDTAIY